MPLPKTPKTSKKPTEKRTLELEIEREKIALENSRIQLENNRIALKREETEFEKLKLNSDSSKNNTTNVPTKIKLKKYNHKSGEDILTYLQDFEAIGKQLKWTDEIMVLQLRTLLIK